MKKADFRAFDPAPPGEPSAENERRFRAAVEAAFDNVDFSLVGLVNGSGAGITEAQADARYLRLIGGTLTGATVLNADPSNLLTMLQIRSRSSDGIHDISFRDDAGSLANRWDLRTQVSPTGSLQLRRDGSALFNLATNGTLTLLGAIGALITGAGGIVSNGEVQARSDGNPSVGFRLTSGPIGALMYLNRSGASADRQGVLMFNMYDPDGSDARVVGRIEDSVAKGGSLSSDQSFVTRELGDLRYSKLGITKAKGNTSGVSIANSVEDIVWGAPVITGAPVSFSGAEITVTEDGTYKFTVTLRTDSNNQTELFIRTFFDTGAGYVEDTDAIVSDYVSRDIDQNTGAVTLIDAFTLTSGDKVKFQGQGDCDGTCIMLDPGTTILVEKVA